MKNSKLAVAALLAAFSTATIVPVAFADDDASAATQSCTACNACAGCKGKDCKGCKGCNGSKSDESEGTGSDS